VNGFQGGKHKKFPTFAEAEAFVKGTSAPSTTSASASAASTSNGKGKGRSMEGNEPAAKRQKFNKDPVFGSQESKFPARRIVYSDGSSKGNGKKGAVAGSGVFWSHEVGAK
jgi:ribonuclease HI